MEIRVKLFYIYLPIEKYLYIENLKKLKVQYLKWKIRYKYTKA